MLFIVNDEKHYTLFNTISKRNEHINVSYVNNAIEDDTRVKVYINVKPENEDDICFIDSWCLSDEIPQAHIISKHDDKQKIRQICEILKISI